MLDAAGTRLRADLLNLFHEPVDSVLDDVVFDRHARACFAYQYERNSPYRAYCNHRGRSPERLTHWLQIPPVPTAAFKEVDLIAGSTSAVEAVFHTSGTTEGLERRGTHHILDLSLYNLSLIPNFAARLLPDDAEMPILSLVPRASELPDSSLALMIAVIMERLGNEQCEYFATARDGIDFERLETALRRFAADGVPVCIVGTSFSFVHWIDSMTERNAHFVLPPGSRLMDTGGYKSRSREVPAELMLTSYEELLGVPSEACVNEYGMTELCSQMYDITLSERVRHGATATRRKRPPPWLRVRIVDPLTLEPVEPGATGLVQMFDLANVGSVCAVQTEDLGVQIEDGYRLLGRAPGAQPRGCSIAMDDLLNAVRKKP
ncbi:MAG: hypothetical protein ABIV28_01320 [Longimicrobiales bacterium]